MIVPSYWAEARTTTRVKGREIALRRYGWSDSSAADAQTQAELRVAEAAQRAASGETVSRRDLKLTYNGAQGLPIREEVLARHGEAVITRNAYGARCLNVPDLLIADVDFETEPPLALKLGAKLIMVLGGIGVAMAFHGALAGMALGLATYLLGSRLVRWPLQRRVDSCAARAKARVQAFIADHPKWRLRVYRTPAGLRLIAVHERFTARSDASRSFMEAIGADPVYVRMCLNQNCFRARLTAKPWRIGIADHLKPRPGVWPIRPERMAAREAWVRRYEREAESFAACHYEETLGHGPEDPGLAPLVALHDAESKALDDIRPLA